MYRIVIADDSVFTRQNLKEILIEAGHQVIGEAGTGLEAVEMYRNLMPDLITMDITMPELNGVDALKQIIALDKDAIIIMMTAIGKPQKVLECLDNGAKHFITKPLEAEKVLSAINQAMDIT